MSVELEMPPQGEGLSQVRALTAYLHRMVQQLSWAFDTLEGGSLSPGPVISIREEAETPAERTPEQIFSDLKNLIIKSADIVESYGEQISKKLSGTYVARSQFGTYEEKSTQEIIANANGISQLFDRAEQITRDLEDFTAMNRESRAYIKSGLLSEDPTPVYGLEVGQTTTVMGKPVFRKYARFTADRLSFFNASDVEVAYISDYRLYITGAQVGGSLELGSRFQIQSDGGLIFKWTGGEKP